MSLDIIRTKIKELYETNPHIHMNVSLSHPKLVLNNALATIKGVYAHTFQIEENTNGISRTHIIQYTDILIKNVTILELKE